MREIGVYLRGLTLFVAGIAVGTVLTSSSTAQDAGKGVLRLNHVGIAVKDFQESLNFYTKIMGFRVAYALPSPDGKPTTTFLQIDRDTFLEMAPASANLPPGITHVGILTGDANGTVTQLRQAGATIPDVRSGGGTGSRLSNVLDPNGIRLEIVEQPAGSLMRKAMESGK
jgi:catechol 2,3-dioxygenase-like lactoylglutathione lyase family enzyme